MIKNYFNKQKIGGELTHDILQAKDINDEKRYIDSIHNHRIKSIYPIMECIYRRKKWLNNGFKKYIERAKPDIFFSFLTNVVLLKPVIEYIKENTNAKIVLFIADDVYGMYNKKNYFRRLKLKREFEEIMKSADKLYGASEEICTEYKKIFNKEIQVLYKGCKFEFTDKEKLNKISKIVYAGNLLYGRGDTLSEIGYAIKQYNNNNKEKALLEIYTGTTITDELNQKLNIPECSIIKGKRDYNEIKQIMSTSELNLHVESFEQKQINDVRYSFSTKIIDCLQSGSGILAVGPDNVASIEYIKRIPGAYVISNTNDINEKIEEILQNKDKIMNNARLVREYALKNHELNKNQLKLRNEFIKLKDK